MKWRALLALLLSPAVAFAGLLEVKLTRPLITFQNTSAAALTYTATNQLLAVDASPTAVQFSSAETPSLVTGTKNLSIRALVDNLGNLVGGVAGNDFTLSGTMTRIVGGVTNTYSGVLLTGEIAGFGYLESGTSDRYDFRFTVTGGALSSFFSSGDIGVQVTSAASTFTGVFSANFNGRAAGNAGLETCPVSIVDWGYVIQAPPAGLTGVVAIAAADHHSLALKSDGTVHGWGYDYYGETIPPADLTNAVAISAGSYHSLALKSDGTVVGWGYFDYATPPAGLTGVLAIEAGNYHGLALKSDGTVVGWGYDAYGEATTPAGLTGVVAIAAGAFHSLALKSDGTVVGWGDTGNGAATPPVDLTNVVAIAAGYYHSLALKSDGTVVGWGNDGNGQATPPPNLTGVTAIAAGGYHSLALESDGMVIGWGANESGQATPPAGVMRVVAITAGGAHSLALTAAAAMPSALTATILATNQVNLSWMDNSVNEDSFKIERAPDDGGNPGTWAQIATVNANVTNYSDVGVMADATYWYRVRATSSACGDSLYSSPAVVSLVPPAAPYSLSAYGVAANQVDVGLSWYAASGTEAGYRIERAPDDSGNPGMWAEIGTVVGGTNTFYIDAGVSPNTPYWYRVRAYNVFGDSPYSDPAVVSVLPPSSPENLYAYAASGNQAAVDLYWNDYYNNSGNVTGYKIDRAPDVNGSPGTWAEIAAVTNGYSYYNFYRDAGLAATNATYWYRVHTYNVVGNAPDSSPFGVTVGPPSNPVYLYAYAASTNQAAVDLYWYDYSNYSGNVAGYKTERAPDVNGSPGTWAEIVAVTNGYSYSSFYRDTGLMLNTTYWYRVRAYNVVGNAPDSSPLSVTVGPPSYPVYPYAYAASANQAAVDLYWYDYSNNSGNVTGYKIDRAPDVNGSPGAWTQISAVTNGYSYSSYYRDTGVMANAKYWYRVRAYNVAGNAPDSSPLSVTVGPPSNAPYSISAYAVTTNVEVDVYWYDYYNDSGNVAGYKLERAPDVNGNPGAWTQIAATTNGFSSYSFYPDTGVMANAKYWYRVRAYNAVGDSPYSYSVSASLVPPAAPYSIFAYTVPTSLEADVYWYINDYNVAGYKIERAPDVNGSPGTWTEISTTVGVYNTSYVDTSVQANTTYWYRVRAYNASGNSPYSPLVSIGIVPPAAPSNLTALIAATNQVNLAWSENDNNVAGYKVEQAPDENGSPGTWTQIGTTVGVSSTSYSDATVQTNQTYWYRVRAYNAAGDSPYSNETSVNLVPPAAPSSLTATNDGPRQISLAWTDNSGNESGFKIERSADGTNFTQIAQVLPNTTSYRNVGLFPNASFAYRVRASNGVGDSDYSNVASASTPPALCVGSVVGWGADWYGQATPPAGLSNVVAIAGGYYHSLALESDGTVVGWGNSYYATPPTNLTAVVAIAAGREHHSLALKSDGTVVGWGDNYYGEATPPANLSNVVAIAAGGYYHSLALKSDGTVVGFGYYYYATPPAGLAGVVAIAAGNYHSLALKSDGTVVGWGDNSYGQATPPAGLSNVVAIAAGLYHSLALKSDGTVIGWGYSYYATPPAGLTNVVAIAAGNYHSLALKSNGAVVGWGDNGYGQATTPAGLNALVIAAGAYHSLALSSGISAPSALVATVISADQVNLSWISTAGGQTEFTIERAPDNGGSPGTWAQIATVGSNITAYSDTGLTAGATYWYRVLAHSGCGDSPYSDVVSVFVRNGQLVRVMQWNAEHGLGRQANNFSSAAQALARIIDYNRPDVLMFCEVDAQGLNASQNQAAIVDWVNNSIPYLATQTFYVAVSSQTDGFNRNAAISRYPILTPGTYNDGLRGLHSFQVQYSGTNVLQVFHTHIKCCSDDCARKHFEAQFDADTISAWAATNAIPYIFAGDWNDDEQSPLCAPPNTITTIREGAGLVEFRPTTLDGEYRTWSTAPATPSIRFDYILAATNRLAPISGYVFSSSVWQNHGLYGGFNFNDSATASDHYCVFADYFFPEGTVTPGPSPIILDDHFPYGTRFLQYLPTSSAWWTSASDSLTAAPGTMTLTVGAGSVMAITYFTPTSSSSPVQLNVGDTLMATFKFIFNGVPTAASSSQGFRIGLFNFADSTLSPKRVTTDGFSAGGQGNGVLGYALFEKMYATFSDDQPMDIRKRTFVADSSLLGTSADYTSLVKNHLNTSQFPGFADLTPYSLRFALKRTGLDSMQIAVTWSNMVNGATLSESTTDNAAANFSFDGIAFRPQNNAQAPAINQFKEVRVELTSEPVAPSIVTQPQDQTVPSGQNATLTVAANGTLPLIYQWYYNTGTPLTNGTNSTLALNNVQSPDEGGYSVIVSNAYGSVTSAVAQLTVLQSPPTIVTQPQSLTVIPGQSALFSVVAVGNNPLSYQWYYNTNILLTNATSATLVLANVQPGNAGSYSVVVSNTIGSVISSNAILTVNTAPAAPVFITQPVSLSVWPGDTASLTGVAVGTQPITYQWKKNGSSIANATNTTYTIANVRASDYGTYSVVASNSIGSVASSNATVNVFQPAFPGAEGFGALTTGGRSGTVYHVTNLNNAGSGSFRDAVSGTNRTVVFDISGTIDLLSDLSITNANLTIAGQTAPGDGVTLRGRLTEVKNTRNVIVRYIRCRPGDINCPNFQDDSFHVVNSSNVVVDHVSASWSIDEVLSVTESTGVSVQWSMIAESLENSCHLTDSGSCCEHHGYGSLLRYGAGGLSLHHNLYAHNGSRNPRLGDDLDLDFVNNVIYNWGGTAGYSGEASEGIPQMNYVNNYVIVGPSSGSSYAFEGGSANTQIYQSGNLMDTNKNGVLDGTNLEWNAFRAPYTQLNSHFSFPQVRTNSATTAYVRVLSSVGASVVRDAVDSRIVSNVLSQNTGAIINSQNQVGGWPTLNSLPAPTDTDQDGMPDFWERAIGLNASDAADRNGFTPDGYTRLEDYLNWLAGPHARVQTNSFVNVELQQYTVGMQSPTCEVSNLSNGVVTLLGDGHTAQFTPAPGFSGLASFLFTATDASVSLTGAVSVLVTPANLVWRGDSIANNWDLAMTANWLGGTNVTKFFTGDIVTFDSTDSNSSTINLVGTLLPSSVTVTGIRNYTFSGTGSLGGVMTLLKSGTGQLALTTSNTFGGDTIVSAGTLLVNNIAGSGTGNGAVTVASGATLGGNGAITGPVTVNGTLAPGISAGTLSISNNLILNGGAVLQYQLGTNSDRTAVSGNLTLGGTLNVTDAGGFTPGVYTLFSFGGSLTYSGVTIGTAPSGYSYGIVTNIPGQVRLSVALSPSTITVAAYDLQDRFGNLMPASGVAVLVADTGTNGFVDPQSTYTLSMGATWGVDDQVVGLWNLNNWGDGALFDQTVVAYTNGIVPGQQLQLYWFPSLTLASNTVGFTYYGKYTDTNSPPLNGSAPWNLPAADSTVELDFITQIEGGSNPDAAGRATLVTAILLTSFQDWQIHHFGTTNNLAAAPAADPDGDGQSNLAEFQAGTDPTNAASTFHIISIASKDNDILITWATAGGRTNVVQFANDLTGSYANISLNINLPGSGDLTTNYVEAGGATNTPFRFYRVRLVP